MRKGIVYKSTLIIALLLGTMEVVANPFTSFKPYDESTTIVPDPEKPMDSSERREEGKEE